MATASSWLFIDLVCRSLFTIQRLKKREEQENWSESLLFSVPHVTADKIIFERNIDILLRLPSWLLLGTHGTACLFLFCSTSHSLSQGQILVSLYQFNSTKLRFKGTSISLTLRDRIQKAFSKLSS